MKLPQRILIIKLAAIGDTCMATPVAANLKKAFPNTKIDWLVSTWAKDVLVNNPDLDEIIEFTPPGHANGILNRVKALVSIPYLIYRLKRRYYDQAFIIHRSKLPGILAKLAGVKETIGFSSQDAGKYLSHSVSYDGDSHEILRNLELLSAVNKPKVTNEMRIMVSAAEKEWAGKMLERLSLPRNIKIIAVSPGGGDNPGLAMHIKRWDWENFVKVIKEFDGQARFLLVGGKDDIKVCDRISKETGALNLAGKTTLRQLAAILQTCDLYIGNDSGPLYIAAALGLKTLSLFGPSDPRLVAPLGDKHRYLWEAGNALDCSPCYKPSTVFDVDFTKCPKGDFKCMQMNDVKAVLESVSLLLAS